MKPLKLRKQSGFTLFELVIAIGLALTVTVAGVTALNKAQDISAMIGQRSDMQQNARSAFNFLATDIGLAGTGMQSGIALPIVTINKPTYGSIFSVCCTAFLNDSNGNPFLYPADGGWSVTSTNPIKHLGSDYKPVPLITVAYEDLAVSSAGGIAGTCHNAPMVLDQTWSAYSPTGSTIKTNGSGVEIDFNPCLDITDPTDPSNALKIGDALLVCYGSCAVGIITGLPGGNAVLLQSGDALNFNQPTATLGSIQALQVGGKYPANATVTRIKIVTYYLDADAGADGIKGTSDDGPPYRLMRRVNAGSPVVLAENILDLQVSYDLWDNTANSGTVATTTIAPSLVRNVNLSINVRSPKPNAKGVYQYLSLATSVAPRNLSYSNRY